jgi:tetratricopeptide (TPR) repeat protein
MIAKFAKSLVSLTLILGATVCVSQTTEQKQQIELHMQKAQSYLREKKPEQAIPELEAVVALDPNNADAQGNLGVLQFFRGDYAAAIPHMRAALAVEPGLTKIEALLGIAERSTGDAAAARREMEAAFPQLEDAKFRTQIGLQLIEMDTASGDLEKAASVAGQLRRIDPENPEILYASYRIYSDLAGESMLTLSLVDPSSAQMHQVIAHEEAKRGDTNGAIAQYRKAIAINPRLPGIHFELAELLNTSDDPKVKQEALQEYLEALKANPDDVKTLCRLGDISAQKGDLNQGYSYYSKAVALQPDSAEVNFGLAKVLISMDQKAKAQPILERAVQLEPTNATAHYRLSTLYREENRPADAKRELDEFLKYKQMKEKLRAVYKEMQIQPDQIREDEKDDK